jgi:hypothetical protein
MASERKAATEETGEVEGPRSFVSFLNNIADGEAEGELSYQLHELVKRMREESVARGDTVSGGLTLKLKFKVDNLGHVIVGYKVTKTEPDRKTSGAHFWLTKGNNLTVENPKQQKLPLREVPGGRARARDITEAKQPDESAVEAGE